MKTNNKIREDNELYVEYSNKYSKDTRINNIYIPKFESWEDLGLPFPTIDECFYYKRR